MYKDTFKKLYFNAQTHDTNEHCMRGKREREREREKQGRSNVHNQTA